MRVIASAAVSSDGYMDDCTPQRLVLSCAEDWAEVHAIRASCDAILVGAETVRRDNPALMIRDEKLRCRRKLCGMSPDIVKVVVSGSGRLDAGLRFFTEGEGVRKIVITSEQAVVDDALRRVAQVIRLSHITACSIIDVLEDEGVETVLVEGGAKIMKMFFDEDAVDDMRLAVAPITVGDDAAPRLPYYGELPFEWRCFDRCRRQVGNMTVCEYAVHVPSEGGLTAIDMRRLGRAIDVSRQSPPCATAYRVGCVVAAGDREYEGYTHETGPANHAEEEALAKALDDGAELRGATVYTSMEPCSKRSSKPVSCTELLLRCGVSRVVYACAEPDCFVQFDGFNILRMSGIEVVSGFMFAPFVRDINAHLTA